MSLQIGRPGRFEFKARDSGEWTVEGYLSTYGNVDEGGDVVMRGAFDRALASSRKVKFLYAHNIESVLGPPLQLHSDDIGLFAKGVISHTTLGQDVHTLLVDGAIDSWSMGYLPTPDGFRFQETAHGLVRLLTDVDLFEGSLLALPMNEEAVVTAIKALGADELAAVLEGKPFPNEHACRLVDPDKFQDGSFRTTTRTHNGKEYRVILGKLKGETTMTQQAFRYPKDAWSASEARAHCKDHDGIAFEAASSGKAPEGDCGCLTGHDKPYERHAANLITMGTEFLERTRQGAALRAADGRGLSEERRAAMTTASGSLREVVKALAAHADELDALLQPPPPAEYVRATDLLGRRLRLRGVDISA